MAGGYLTYRYLINPLTRGLRKEIAKNIEPGSEVLDIACGPGTLLYELSSKIKMGTGIDLDEGKIKQANSYIRKKNIDNLSYEVVDATKLKSTFNNKFDFVILSLAIHQFPEPLRSEIIEQSLEAGRTIIFADYTVPVPGNYSGWIARFIEKLAGKEHYAAYKSFVKNGGLDHIAKSFNLNCISLSTIGTGVFTIAKFEISV